jgi:hypothetical protein
MAKGARLKVIHTPKNALFENPLQNSPQKTNKTLTFLIV